MTKALRITFPGIEPFETPLDDVQAAQFNGLFSAAAADPSIANMLWPQLEASLRAELAKQPGNAEKLAALPAGTLRPELEVVDVVESPEESSTTGDAPPTDDATDDIATPVVDTPDA